MPARARGGRAAAGMDFSAPRQERLGPLGHHPAISDPRQREHTYQPNCVLAKWRYRTGSEHCVWSTIQCERNSKGEMHF